MQACNRCHAVYINETVKYHFLYFSRSSAIFLDHFTQQTDTLVLFFSFEKKTSKKKIKKNRLGQVKTRNTSIY